MSRIEEAARYARQFCQEFPDNPIAFFTLVAVLGDQQAMSRENTDEIAECAKNVERLLSRAHGNEPWLVDMSLVDMRARLLDLKQCIDSKRDRGPALKAAQNALNEFIKDDGDIAKAAHAIEEALEPDLKYPNPRNMRAL